MNWLDVAFAFASAGATLMAMTQLRLNWSRQARVARAMHELRNPLHTAMLVAGQPGAVDDRIAVHLRRCALALEQFESGGRVERNTLGEFDVNDVVHGLVAAWPNEPRLRSSTAGAAGLVRGDRRLLEQAISNLIANALEHGEGEVSVSVASLRGTVKVTVRDQGSGFERRLADRFGRLRRNKRGHGLAIASTAVAMLGGRLTTMHGAGGAAVAIELPLAAVKILRPRGAEVAIVSARVR